MLPEDFESLNPEKNTTPKRTAKKKALIRADDASALAGKLTVFSDPPSFDLTILQKMWTENLVENSTASLVYNRAGAKPEAKASVFCSEESMLRDDALWTGLLSCFEFVYISGLYK